MSNRDLDPFANDDLSEEELHTRSKHTFRFGQFLHRYKVSLIFMVLGLLLGLLFTGFLIADMVRNGTPDIRTNPLPVFPPAILLAGSPFAVYCAWRYFTIPRKLTIDESGMTWSTMSGKRDVSWEDIAHVWRYERVVFSNQRPKEVEVWESKVTIQFNDGTKLILDHSLTGYKKLAAKILYFSALQLLPKKLAELREGAADFGPVILEPDQIRLELGANDFFKKVSIAWDDLSRWGLCNGVFVLKVKKKRHVCDVAEIPDYRVLCGLIEEMSGTKQARPGALGE